MSDIITTGISALVQTIMTVYFIILLTQGLENKTYTKCKILLSSLIIAIGTFTSAYVEYPNVTFKILTCAIPSFIALKFVLKTNLIKSVLITIGTFISFAITELIAMFAIVFIFECGPTDILKSLKLLSSLIIIQMILLLLLIKLTVFMISKFTKFKKLSDNINSNQLLNLTLLIGICILPKVLIRGLNNYEYSTSFLITSVVETIIIGITIFVFFKRTVERDKAQSELFISETHNKTMIGMVDGVRTLKHDYNNIIQALSGYVTTKQYDKLEEHIKKVLQECNVVNNLSVISPNLFNEPAIYGIMGAKYFLAIEKDIVVDLDVSCDFTKICFPMPELSRIFGILLDNAMEATEKCKEKYVRFEAHFDKRKNADVIRILNTYDTSINIDLDKIYEKGVSSKEVKSGIGLWEVKKLIKKNKNSQIYPTIENEKFVQNLIIERLFESEDKDLNGQMMIPLN